MTKEEKRKKEIIDAIHAKKPRIKTHGFMEWFMYHSENDTLMYFIFRLIISVLVAFITTIIVVNCYSSSKVGNCKGTNNTQENVFNKIEK